jgi:hypothetical protein
VAQGAKVFFSGHGFCKDLMGSVHPCTP